MPESDLQLLREAAERAAGIALSHWKRTPRSWDKGGGAGPVSEADLAVNEALREMLTGARPDYGWLSEESDDDPARLGRERVFIVDPIDGTRAFLAGAPNWAHSLAVAHGGEVQSAVVHVPAHGRMFSARRGEGAWLDGRRLAVAAPKGLSDARILAGRGVMDPRNWRGEVPALERHFRPSLAYRLALVGQGRFDAMLTTRPTWEWDVAAGGLIAEEAGARVSDLHGRAPRFNRPEPRLAGLLAAPPALHAALRARLAPVA